jgi:hypothetical protein
MVATMEDNGVTFVTGRRFIDPSTLTVEEWVEIIRAAIEEIPLYYLRGMQSVKQILQHGESQLNGYTMEMRRVPEALPSIPIKTLDGTRKLLRHSELFLHCGEVGSFPQGTYAADRWRAAERIPGDDSTEIAPVIVGNYILSKDAKLYYMKTEWHPWERWDERMIASSPEEFWYEPKPQGIEELDDAGLAQLLRKDPVENLASRMLHRFHQALVSTTGEMQNHLLRTLQKQHTIHGFLDRIGEGIY